MCDPPPIRSRILPSKRLLDLDREREEFGGLGRRASRQPPLQDRRGKRGTDLFVSARDLFLRDSMTGDVHEPLRDERVNDLIVPRAQGSARRRRSCERSPPAIRLTCPAASSFSAVVLACRKRLKSTTGMENGAVSAANRRREETVERGRAALQREGTRETSLRTRGPRDIARGHRWSLRRRRARAGLDRRARVRAGRLLRRRPPPSSLALRQSSFNPHLLLARPTAPGEPTGLAPAPENQPT